MLGLETDFSKFYKILFNLDDQQNSFDLQDSYLYTLGSEYHMYFCEALPTEDGMWLVVFKANLLGARPSYEDERAVFEEDDDYVYTREEYEEDYPLEEYHTEGTLQEAVREIAALPYVLSIEPYEYEPPSCAARSSVSKSVSKDDL